MTEEPNKDKFEISFRILGNEIFGMEILSQSKMKNWAFFGVLTLAALTLVFSELGPAIIDVIDAVSNSVAN
jgi:hypothetical protein